MAQQNNKLILVIGGQEYTGWTSVSVRRSLETLCGSFSATLIDANKAILANIKPNVKCEVYLDSDKIITGIIDDYSPEVGAAARSLSIAGRCRTADLVDCSAIYKTGTWSGSVPLLTVCKNLCSPFGITVRAETELGTNLVNFALNQGESPYEAMHRACEPRGILLLSDSDGNLVLTTSGKTRANDALILGENILSVSAKWSFSNRFSEYRVRGTLTSDGEGWGDSPQTKIAIEGIATDSNFPRYRPKIISATGMVSTGDAKKQAAWEMQVRIGKSNTSSAQVVGWRQSNGALWRENFVTYLRVDEISLNSEMLISEVEYSQSDSGTLTSLVLVPPDTYAPNPLQKKAKKAKSESWGGW